MKRMSSFFLLLAAPLALSAQASPWQPQVAVIWSEPQGGLKDVTGEHALGLSLGGQVQQMHQ